MTLVSRSSTTLPHAVGGASPTCPADCWVFFRKRKECEMALRWRIEDNEIVSDSWDFGKHDSTCYWLISPKNAGYRLAIYKSFRFADDPEGTWYLPHWGEDFDSVEEAKRYAEDLGKPIAA